MSNFIPSHTQTAVRLLRLSLWLLPAILLPLPFVLMRIIDGMTLFLAFVPFLAITAAIGYFDMRLIYQWERRESQPDRVRLICWALAFVLIQLLVAPAVFLLLALSMEFVNEGILLRLWLSLP